MVGVRVEAGIIKTGTPICVPSKDFIYIGICTGIQHNNKVIQCLTISVPTDNYYCTVLIWTGVSGHSGRISSAWFVIWDWEDFLLFCLEYEFVKKGSTMRVTSLGGDHACAKDAAHIYGEKSSSGMMQLLPLQLRLFSVAGVGTTSHCNYEREEWEVAISGGGGCKASRLTLAVPYACFMPIFVYTFYSPLPTEFWFHSQKMCIIS